MPEQTNDPPLWAIEPLRTERVNALITQLEEITRAPASRSCNYVSPGGQRCIRTAPLVSVIVSDIDDEEWCQYHASNYATRCDHCMYFTDDRLGGCNNEECYPEDEDGEPSYYGPRLIHDYYYRPELIFHGDGPSFYGFELEVETPRGDEETAHKALRAFRGEARDLVYLKHDSSVDGFELVTHPMSYGWALDHFPYDVLDVLKSERARAAESCGLHIHVNRNGFSSPTHQYRWLKFWYRNERGISAIARRRDSQWAQFRASERGRVKTVVKPELGWRSRYEGRYRELLREREVWLFSPSGYGHVPGHTVGNFEHETEFQIARARYERESYMRESGPDRYSAVNTCNTNTFEMRVFASTLERQQLQAALGLASASVEYTRNLTSREILHNDGWTWPAFRAWVDDRPDYAPLSAEMSIRCAF